MTERTSPSRDDSCSNEHGPVSPQDIHCPGDHQDPYIPPPSGSGEDTAGNRRALSSLSIRLRADRQHHLSAGEKNAPLARLGEPADSGLGGSGRYVNILVTASLRHRYTVAIDVHSSGWPCPVLASGGYLHGAVVVSKDLKGNLPVEQTDHMVRAGAVGLGAIAQQKADEAGA